MKYCYLIILPFSKVREYDIFLLTYNFVDFRIYDGLINTMLRCTIRCLVGWYSPIGCPDSSSLPQKLTTTYIPGDSLASSPTVWTWLVRNIQSRRTTQWTRVGRLSLPPAVQTTVCSREDMKYWCLNIWIWNSASYFSVRIDRREGKKVRDVYNSSQIESSALGCLYT